MAEVTGPCSTLPGAIHTVPAGTMCDDHPDREATKRVQGETDSFGSELHDMCQECYDAHKKYMADTAVERATGCCDWCKKHATDLRRMRDFEEGMGGPLYDVCGACRRRQNDELEEELRESGHYDYDDGHLECELDSAHDDYDPTEDAWYDEAAAEAGIQGPALPVAALPSQGYPRAYVDGRFIY